MMKKLNSKGFSVVELLLILFVAAIVGGVVYYIYSIQNKPKSSTQQQSAAEQDVVLQNVGLASFDDIDVTTQATREFESKGLKGFYIFGDSLSGGRTNPNFEYASLKSGTKIISASDGVVVFVKDQTDSKDVEVLVQPKEGSAWTIGYDHVANAVVKKGDTIKAGDVIGEPAIQNNGLTRFELQINKDQNGVTTHYCPTSLLVESVKDKIFAGLTDMQNKWESVTGYELYDLAKQSPVGCLMTSMTSAQAERTN